jgi:hypothetical protein
LPASDCAFDPLVACLAGQLAAAGVGRRGVVVARDAEQVATECVQGRREERGIAELDRRPLGERYELVQSLTLLLATSERVEKTGLAS